MPRGRPKIQRTPEEEEEFQAARRARNAEAQRQRRANRRLERLAIMQGDVTEDHRDQRRVIINNAQSQDRDRVRNEHRPNFLTETNQDNSRTTPQSRFNIREHYIGKMNIRCEHCSALHFEEEKVSRKGLSFNDCCSHGNVRLECLPPFPPYLKSLLDGDHDKSRLFFDRIRVYNSSISIASFNANLTNFENRRPGPYCFKIQGQIYYQINTALYPAEHESPSFGQLFIVDSEEAIRYRMDHGDHLDYDIMSNLDTMMRDNNQFAKSYQMMNEVVREQEQINSGNQCTSLDSAPQLQLLFNLKSGLDKRRYNFQRTNEVAAVFATTADGEIPESYVTIRNVTTKQLQIVSTMDPNVEPWVYPLFFPYGTAGWHRDIMRLTGNRRVSRCAYTKYQLAIRDDFNPFIRGKRLFQQWLVDNYVKIEKDRIQFCKDNQKKLRAESYKGLIDHLQNSANNVNGRVGKMVILPSTFIGSPRNMIQNYQDAMAIVRKFGRPDLFITMTCNPNWKEIVENLLPGQTSADRPDLITRVFNIKKDYLIDLIKKESFFGQVAAFVHVIEFQKRGLPHVHLLVTLERHCKLSTPDSVDSYISAEIPSPFEHPVLHKAVMKHMIHGPCGDWCTVNNKCTKHYPMSYQNETIIDGDGFPQYRRRNTGVTYPKSNNFHVDNRHVVPYNAELLLKLDCHLNVVAVSSIKSVKYLYKYIYKGHDAAAISVEEPAQENVINHDEITHFIESRYVGPTEAVWRILSKPLHEKSHAIIRLPIHLPNEHNILIDEENDDDQLNEALNKQTMLIDYFALNERDSEAQQYSYMDIPLHYTFKKVRVEGQNIERWERRKKCINIIGRMYSVSPTQIELFHLRLLLLHVKGAKSFTDLRTVDNTIHQTFVAAV